MWTLLGTAFGLAMDSLSVSISDSLNQKHTNITHALKASLSFGLFQGFMPLIGWLIGSKFKLIIAGFDHWIAFGLLMFIGIKMIAESKNKTIKGLDHFPTLILLSLATSIDALIVGASFSFLSINIISAISVIGSLTFILCLLGVLLSKKIGKYFDGKTEILGGLILIIIGTKILLTHLFF